MRMNWNARASSPPPSLSNCSTQCSKSKANSSAGDLAPILADEDVHTFLERELTQRLKAIGGKLRAGRSRNDQAANDLRLYLRDKARKLALAVIELQHALIEQADGARANHHGRLHAFAAGTADCVRASVAGACAVDLSRCRPAGGLGSPQRAFATWRGGAGGLRNLLAGRSVRAGTRLRRPVRELHRRRRLARPRCRVHVHHEHVRRSTCRACRKK